MSKSKPTTDCETIERFAAECGTTDGLNDGVPREELLAAQRRSINQPHKFIPHPDPSLPSHLIGIVNPDHTAVCADCGNWITVGDDGTELGHARKGDNSKRGCEHRPENVDPVGEQR